MRLIKGVSMVSFKNNGKLKRTNIETKLTTKIVRINASKIIHKEFLPQNIIYDEIL